MTALRFFRIETGRMARRWAFWAGVLVLAAIAWSNMVPGARMGEGLFGAFGREATQDDFVFAVPVFVGVTVAGSLAADRRRCYPALVLIRGLSRPRYLLVKAAAMFWVAAAGTFLACAAAFVAAAPFLRWTAAGMGRMEPYPGLLASHTLAGDAVIALLLSLAVAAAALALSCLGGWMEGAPGGHVGRRWSGEDRTASVDRWKPAVWRRPNILLRRA